MTHTESSGDRGQGKINMLTVLGDRPTYLMLFFLQDKDNIAGLDARSLVSFPSERYLLTVLHAFVHVYL